MTRTSDETIVRLAIEAALQAGASAAEGFFSRSSSTTVEVSGGKVENVKVRDGSGIGVRVLVETRLGFAHTSDLSDSAVKKTAKDAVANAQSSAPDPYNRLPAFISADKYRTELGLAPLDEALVSGRIGMEERIDRALSMESTARAYDKRIAKVRQSSVSDAVHESYVSNSNGVGIHHRITSCTASILAVAEANGEASQMGWDFEHSFAFKDLHVKPVGARAAQRALELLGARKIETATVPVILDAPVAGEFLAAVGQALMADQVQKRKSLFAGRVGENVANDAVTIIDDGMYERGIAPAPADGEGVPSQKTVLIDSGTLKGFLHNAYTAARDGVASTGNGVRSSYASLPEVGPSNFYLVPGTVTRTDLIAGCSRAYLVTDVMGMHTVDSVSGDFSVGATGLWIEDGKVKFPVRETTIAGNVRDVLLNIKAVGDDLKFYSRFGSPTIL
ncbi:MAG: TldD/PmbA family protein, partial [Candidatus Abyssobacteria bacterium SURF_17]